MRPVDLLPTTPHPKYDATFDKLSGQPMLVLQQKTWKQLPDKSPYFKFLFKDIDDEEPIERPDKVDFDGTTHLQMRRTNTVDLDVFDRDGRLMRINAELHAVQVDSTDANNTQKKSQRWRVVVPPNQAADLARFWKEDTDWNRDKQKIITETVGKGILDKVEFDGTYRPEKPEKYIGYRGAVEDLEWAIGGYCSYCEARRQDSTTCDIEHRLPKSWYPSERLRWDNFLFACKVCNSTFKSSRPSRSFGIRNAIDAYHQANKPTYNGGDQAPVVDPATKSRLPYDEIVQACDEYVAWPNTDDKVPRAANTMSAPGTNSTNTNATAASATGANTTTTNTTNASATAPTNYSLLCFSYKLYEWDVTTNAPLYPVPFQDQLDARTKDGKDDASSNTVLVQAWDSQLNAVRQMNVRVMVEARSPGTGNADFDNRKSAAATETIQMVGLNGVASAYGDRRILERTHAWLRAVETVRYLKSLQARLTDASDQPLIDGAYNQAAVNVELGGYYSTWLTVFKHVGDAYAKKLAEIIDGRAATNNSVFQFHGTNLVNSVTNMIPGL